MGPADPRNPAIPNADTKATGQDSAPSAGRDARLLPQGAVVGRYIRLRWPASS
jgi:hypothetical protein